MLLLLTFLMPASGLLMFDKVEGDNPCLLAMCEADSGCVPKGCTIDQFDRIGCGYFRMNIYQFRQCYQPGKAIDEEEEEAWIRCAEDYECSANCIKSIGNRFRAKCGQKSDCEALARIHDGGANGCRDRKTVLYWKTVRKECQSQRWDCSQAFLGRQRQLFG